jgi:release factor glutamine methyltransferase
MSVSELYPSPSSVSSVVTALRSAGCVFAEDEADLLISAARDPHELAAMVERRIAGLPLEHVLGWAEFCGVRVAVDPGVFVPRRRSEFLVGRAIALAPPRPVVVDLCCGSGALGAAVLRAVGAGELHAADIEPAAVRCALRNVGPVGGRVHQGDLYDPLPAGLAGRVDVLIANAPYVPTGEIGLLPPEARDFEPLVALDGGPDGLGIQRRVTARAGRWLAPGGSLLIETSERQAPSTVAAFTRHGLQAEVAVCEDLDATVVIGTRPAHAAGADGSLAR